MQETSVQGRPMSIQGQLEMSGKALQNANAALATMEWSKGETVVTSFPRQVLFAITDACNQHCRFCTGTFRKPHESIYADPEMFDRLDWLKFPGEILVTGTGEPLCHPEYARIVRAIHAHAPKSDVRLYSNGQGLRGDRLEATLESCNSVHISANAISKKAFDAVIERGSQQVLLENLNALAERKPRSMTVILSIVVVKQTINEVRKLIDFASARGFQQVIAMRGVQSPRVLEHGGLTADSFDLNYADYVDVQELRDYAASKNVLLVMEQRNYSHPCGGMICQEPWAQLRLSVEGKGPERGSYQLAKGWRAQTCCVGECKLFATHEAVVHIQDVWNSERFQMIRRTVNTEEVIINKMCAWCRMSRYVESGDYDRREAIRAALRLEAGQPFFPEQWVDHLEENGATPPLSGAEGDPCQCAADTDAASQDNLVA